MSTLDRIDGRAANETVPLQEWDPKRVEALYSLYFRGLSHGHDIEERLAELEAEHGGIVYSEMIHLLSHLRFPADEARQHWFAITDHRNELERARGCTVDMRVALLSYFLEVNRQFESPKIIELKLFEETRDHAYRDSLTGLPNYRLFREHLDQEMIRAERTRSPVSLLMIDVDDFKAFNDRHGHETANEALCSLADLLVDSLRNVDIAARYGGEEFVLILASTLKLGAQAAAERIRKRAAMHTFVTGDGAELARLTVSIGIATYPADAIDVDELIRRADQAMYLAKSSGKNRVQLYGENIRSFQRLRASMDGRFRAASADSHTLTTVDVCEGGLRFVSERRLQLGSLVDLSLMLPDGSREISAAGRVMRCEEGQPGRYETAVRIAEMDTRDRRDLSVFLDDGRESP